MTAVPTRSRSFTRRTRAPASGGWADIETGKINDAIPLALVYLGLGDRARALDYLEQAYATDSQWMGWLKEDRMFDPLRSEPHFLG